MQVQEGHLNFSLLRDPSPATCRVSASGSMPAAQNLANHLANGFPQPHSSSTIKTCFCMFHVLLSMVGGLTADQRDRGCTYCVSGVGKSKSTLFKNVSRAFIRLIILTSFASKERLVPPAAGVWLPNVSFRGNAKLRSFAPNGCATKRRMVNERRNWTGV